MQRKTNNWFIGLIALLFVLASCGVEHKEQSTTLADGQSATSTGKKAQRQVQPRAPRAASKQLAAEKRQQLPAGGTQQPNDQPYDLTFYENYGVNPFVPTEDRKFSTFGMDVDHASYTKVRNYLLDGNLPDKDVVRTEEFVNYFDQAYPEPEQNFGLYVDGAQSRFERDHYQLLRVGVKTRELSRAERKQANITFVIDTSGSMGREDRLGLVKKSLQRLATSLKPGDRVGLVVFGSRGKIVSELTGNADKILSKISELQSGGSTNAEQGLTLGYKVAERGYEPGKINRIVFCGDGVANVGRTRADQILDKVKGFSRDGITLTALGFGMANYNDVLLEKLANHGDGNYYYLDSTEAAKRLFSGGATRLLQVAGSDAKTQVEFDPEVVDRYRLIGYENRRLEKEDFRDTNVDAGEVGAGHTVTALYEVRVRDAYLDRPRARLGTARIRYQDLETREAAEIAEPIRVRDVVKPFDQVPARFRFTAAVAEFAELLKESYWARDGSLAAVERVAETARKELATGEKEREFLKLVRQARKLRKDET